MLNYAGILAGIILLLFGLINCFLGYRLFKVILPVSVFLAGGYLIGSILYTLGSSVQVALISGIAGGLVLAVLSVIFYFAGVFIIGAGFGGMIALSVHLPLDDLTRLALTVVLIIAGGVLGIVLQKSMIIIATSFSGAYLLFNGLFYTGYYLNGQIMTLRKFYSMMVENTQIYSLLLIFSLITGVAGIVIQYRHFQRKSG
jgi:hypothetical protein